MFWAFSAATGVVVFKRTQQVLGNLNRTRQFTNFTTTVNNEEECE